MREPKQYLPATAFEGARWQKASHSEPNQGCVEFTKVGDIIAMRDSKLAADSPILQFDAVEIAAMLSGAKDGEFDHLIN
ncbi:DUF397 domain-containing protein [Amycolatopsis nalaikhensis]|uniref:DUF397 domain-containing protein n=1 Tax=Amycolatopsis nalaikhensis TaxID=715472 RepID=A0ABY8XYV7_9PSEU|nr:DUF397 domain-containing protein [Amycolatopsis sp. 2-2]WIV60783.1 DUF397 domain-containing protein [Amycolatopsis sp. 2-2]